MSEWVTARSCKPPTSKSVLLYVVSLHHDEENLWSEEIILGFWSDEMDDDYEGWYQEMFESYEPFKETSTVKVLAWTLLPESPCIKFKNQECRTDLLEAFKDDNDS